MVLDFFLLFFAVFFFVHLCIIFHPLYCFKFIGMTAGLIVIFFAGLVKVLIFSFFITSSRCAGRFDR